jgi:phosphosulfolactate phosphohydrolase-like enzyme
VAAIDVFRAFTTAAVALSNGASSIVIVRSVGEALALRNAGIGHRYAVAAKITAPIAHHRGVNVNFTETKKAKAIRETSSK